VVEDFAATVFRNLDVFYLILNQVVIQEVHIDNFLHGLLVVDDVVESSRRQKCSRPSLRLRISTLRLKEKALYFIPCAFVARFFFFVLFLGLFF
jgi:hypothetical protein